jgi:hypothetical protein
MDLLAAYGWNSYSAQHLGEDGCAPACVISEQCDPLLGRVCIGRIARANVRPAPLARLLLTGTAYSAICGFSVDSFRRLCHEHRGRNLQDL